jgi:hypothetical protein
MSNVHKKKCWSLSFSSRQTSYFVKILFLSDVICTALCHQIKDRGSSGAVNPIWNCGLIVKFSEVLGNMLLAEPIKNKKLRTKTAIYLIYFSLYDKICQTKQILFEYQITINHANDFYLSNCSGFTPFCKVTRFLIKDIMIPMIFPESPCRC